MSKKWQLSGLEVGYSRQRYFLMNSFRLSESDLCAPGAYLILLQIGNGSPCSSRSCCVQVNEWILSISTTDQAQTITCLLGVRTSYTLQPDHISASM